MLRQQYRIEFHLCHGSPKYGLLQAHNSASGC
jgi:hypothetical protein